MELENYWMFYQTSGEQLPTHAAAVSIDCEMGSSQAGESELIRVTVIDYFNAEVLLDSLVYPDTKMAHYNTRFSGVTRKAMEDSRRQQKCLLGKGAARSAVLRFVGPDTIVIGHGLHMDLTSLRWVHTRVVDTFLLEQRRRRREEEANRKGDEMSESEEGKQEGAEDEDESKFTETKREQGGLSLKTLAKQRLLRVIQQGHGHDSVEDAMATRDLLHWHVLDALASVDEQPQFKEQQG